MKHHESLTYYKAWSSTLEEYGSHYGTKREFQRLCKEYKRKNLNVTTITKYEYRDGLHKQDLEYINRYTKEEN